MSERRKSGGQPGNKNSTKNMLWRAAIKKALRKRSQTDRYSALVDIADKMLELALEGDLAAMRELGDRIDGKSAQRVSVDGGEGKPLAISGVINLVKPSDDSDVDEDITKTANA